MIQKDLTASFSSDYRQKNNQRFPLAKSPSVNSIELSVIVGDNNEYQMLRRHFNPSMTKRVEKYWTLNFSAKYTNQGIYEQAGHCRWDAGNGVIHTSDDEETEKEAQNHPIE
eukprot:gene7388-15084_t